MKILTSKAFVGLVCFLVGAAAVLTAQRFATERHKDLKFSKGKLQFKNGALVNMDSVFDEFYNDDFFNRADDPFEQMRQMRNRLTEDFHEANLGSGDVGEIKRREDKDFVYYDIGIKGIDKKNLNFKIVDRQISISGQVENKSEENGTGTYFSSSFHRSFPVPSYVDGKRVQVEQDKDRVTLKFPRLSTAG
ncbi:MAG: Hsp20/alpha crystallin family protein [Bdellovibrionia bacterium]